MYDNDAKYAVQRSCTARQNSHITYSF